MVTLYTPYSDLSEVGSLSVPYDKYGMSFEDHFKEVEKTIQTPLAIITATDFQYGSVFDILDDNGWQEAAVALNWHDTHKGDSILHFFYKEFEGMDPSLIKAAGKDHKYSSHRSQKFTCAMGLLDTGTPSYAGSRSKEVSMWPLSDIDFGRQYFTLLREDHDFPLGSGRKEELIKNRFRKLVSTPLANYYVNGWEPDQHPGKYEEWEYWDYDGDSDEDEDED